MDILPFLALDGTLRPLTPEGEAVVQAARGEVLRIEVLTPRRLHTRQQEKFWWSVAVPLIGRVWCDKLGWVALPPNTKQFNDAVHDQAVRIVFGEIETPLGKARKSSTTLTVEQYSSLIEWADEYLLTLGVHLPSPGEVEAL